MGAPNEKQVFYTVKIGEKMLDVTGRKRTPLGYVQLCIKQHPYASVDGYVMEHRVVMEKKMGRFLMSDEIIHHLNEVKHDNRISNLEVMGREEHIKLHHTGAKRSEETRRLMSKKMKARIKNKKEHPFYKDVDDELSKLYKKGVNNTEIARRLNVTRQTVRRKILYLGLENDKNEFK